MHISVIIPIDYDSHHVVDPHHHPYRLWFSSWFSPWFLSVMIVVSRSWSWSMMILTDDDPYESWSLRIMVIDCHPCRDIMIIDHHLIFTIHSPCDIIMVMVETNGNRIVMATNIVNTYQDMTLLWSWWTIIYGSLLYLSRIIIFAVNPLSVPCGFRGIYYTYGNHHWHHRRSHHRWRLSNKSTEEVPSLIGGSFTWWRLLHIMTVPSLDGGPFT